MALLPYSQLRQSRNELGLKEYWGATPPSLATDVGPFQLGDIMWHTAPGPAGYMGWVCVSAGATGATSTWKGFGLIEA